jgi:glutamate-rich WD-repeat protein
MITCVKRNSSNGFIIVSGNDLGELTLWDLRNNATELLRISAHSSLISEMQYKPNDSSSLLTSSFDGQLLKWQFDSNSQLSKVDCLFGSNGDPPINSFHVNNNNQVIFSTEIEALYYGSV